MPEDTQTRTGLSRRSLMKTGANAAWAVPVVTVAAAAPAMALTMGSNMPLQVAVTSATRALNQLSVTGTITNPVGGVETTNLSVNVNLSPGTAGDFTTSTANAPSAGFNSGDVTSPGSPPLSRNFQYFPTAGQIQPGQTLPFSATYTLAPTASGGTVFLTTVESNGDTAQGSMAFA